MSASGSARELPSGLIATTRGIRAMVMAMDTQASPVRGTVGTVSEDVMPFGVDAKQAGQSGGKGPPMPPLPAPSLVCLSRKFLLLVNVSVALRVSQHGGAADWRASAPAAGSSTTPANASSERWGCELVRRPRRFQGHQGTLARAGGGGFRGPGQGEKLWVHGLAQLLLEI